MTPPPHDDTARSARIAGDLFRRESARLVAMLAGQFGVHRLELAEDVVQEALVRALQTWPYRGVPDNPAAWLTQTAKHLALDHLRREQRWHEKEDGIAMERERWLAGPVATEDSETFADNTLRMMFVCFHPQLSAEAQTALALRTLCGLSPAEIAAAFLTSEAAISKRLVRARQRIRELALPFAVPGPDELPARLHVVLGTLYLLFNEGYKASAGDRLVREELCHEAIRLALLLTAHPATVELTIKVGGIEREVLLFAPSNDGGAAAPVVFGFHGHGGNARHAARSFRIQELWPEALEVYPQGLPTPGQLTDPEGKRDGWQHAAGAQDDRDLKFFDAILTELHAQHKVDAARIYDRTLERRRLHLSAMGAAARGLCGGRAVGSGRAKPARAHPQTRHAPCGRKRRAGEIQLAAASDGGRARRQRLRGKRQRMGAWLHTLSIREGRAVCVVHPSRRP